MTNEAGIGGFDLAALLIFFGGGRDTRLLQFRIGLRSYAQEEEREARADGSKPEPQSEA